MGFHLNVGMLNQIIQILSLDWKSTHLALCQCSKTACFLFYTDRLLNLPLIYFISSVTSFHGDEDNLRLIRNNNYELQRDIMRRSRLHKLLFECCLPVLALSGFDTAARLSCNSNGKHKFNVSAENVETYKIYRDSISADVKSYLSV